MLRRKNLTSRKFSTVIGLPCKASVHREAQSRRTSGGTALIPLLLSRSVCGITEQSATRRGVDVEKRRVIRSEETDYCLLDRSALIDGQKN